MNILGVNFSSVSLDKGVVLVLNDICRRRKIKIALSNPEFLLESKKNRSLLNYLNRVDYNFADGIGVVWASKILYEKPIPERVTGTDFLPCMFEEAKKRGLKFFFFGGKPGVAEKAKWVLEKKFNYTNGVAGCHHGFGENEESIIREINSSGADILMVCLGNPIQERWIEKHFDKLEVLCVFGNGGALDFWSEGVKRAPMWMQEVGVEWLFRLFQNFTWARIKRQSKLVKFPFYVLRQFISQRFRKY